MYTPEKAPFETKSFHSPNLLPDPVRSQEPEPRLRPRRIRVFSCLFIVIILVVTSCTALLARSNNNFFVGVKNGFLLRQLTHIFTGSSYELKGEKNDRINFLLMGVGGPGHDGAYLTDTIILASFKPSTKEASMLSIPRDLIVPMGNGTYSKINSIYALDMKNGIDHAFAKTKDIIGQTFGVPINYMAVLDFDGFIKLIDTIGGVSVTVDRDFTDRSFPAGPNLYQTLSFKKGTQKMNGLTALNYARSRHGNNTEGSDFARSKRQQKIILATKEKLASYDTLLNPFKLTTLFNLVNQYTKTDIEPWEIVKLVQMTKDIKPDHVYDTVLDDLPGGYLTSGISSVDGAYILQPVGGSFAQLRNLVQNVFNDSALRKEDPKVMIMNGTTVANTASIIASSLEKAGVKPIAVGNAAKQNYLTTEIYDYTDGKKPATRDFLASWFGTEPTTNIPLEFLNYTVTRQWDLKDASGQYQNLDFLVILGQDAQSKSHELIRTLTPGELKATTTPTSTINFAPVSSAPEAKT